MKNTANGKKSQHDRSKTDDTKKKFLTQQLFLHFSQTSQNHTKHTHSLKSRPWKHKTKKPFNKNVDGLQLSGQ